VEHQNRLIKERARGMIQTLPYGATAIPRKIRVALIQYVVFWLNLIPKDEQVYLLQSSYVESKSSTIKPFVRSLSGHMPKFMKI
jgi:hypothetical protein